MYRNQIGEAQAPPPYTFPNVSINSFRLKGDLDQLTELCDDLLNVGDVGARGFEFRPIFQLLRCRGFVLSKDGIRIFSAAWLYHSK